MWQCEYQYRTHRADFHPDWGTQFSEDLLTSIFPFFFAVLSFGNFLLSYFRPFLLSRVLIHFSLSYVPPEGHFNVSFAKYSIFQSSGAGNRNARFWYLLQYMILRRGTIFHETKNIIGFWTEVQSSVDTSTIWFDSMREISKNGHKWKGQGLSERAVRSGVEGWERSRGAGGGGGGNHLQILMRAELDSSDRETQKLSWYYYHHYRRISSPKPADEVRTRVWYCRDKSKFGTMDGKLHEIKISTLIPNAD